MIVLGGSPAALAQVATLEVDDDHADCPAAAFTTIQSAVDAAAELSGPQVIRVCRGSYLENVTISGDQLDVLGDGAEGTILQGVPGTAGPIVAVEPGSRVRLEGMTITGAGSMSRGRIWGVRFREASGRISDSIVRDVRDVNGRADAIGIGIESFGPTIDVEVRGNRITNIMRHGVQVTGPGAHARIGDNHLVGPAAPKHSAPNGINVLRGAQAMVKHNEVHDMTSPAVALGAGSGIIVGCSGATQVYRNTVHASDLGVSIVDATGVGVEQNGVFDALYDAYTIQAIGMYFGDPSCPGGVRAPERNVLRGNHAERSGGNGISVVSYDLAYLPARNRITHNTVASAGANGLVIYHGAENTVAENDLATTSEEDADARDDTRGARSSGTANAWWLNTCGSSLPAGLCTLGR